MKIMILGAQGQLGLCLRDAIVQSTHQGVFYSRAECDVTDADAVIKVLLDTKPDVVINASAYTAVDKAETESDAAFAVNATAVRYLAQACQNAAIPLLHVSTDYVFNGTATEPYKTTDPVAPKSVYGASKLAGEQAIAELCQRFIIVRTSWVFSEYGNNFVKTMRRLMQERSELPIVSDQMGCPTYAGDLARFLLLAVDRIEHGFNAWGIYHYSNSDVMSWYQFASFIRCELEQQGVTPLAQLKAISTEQYPTPARRPAYSVLDCSSLEQAFATRLQPVAAGLSNVCAKLNDC